jgi:septal ring factor EnvC (AmiA/AmiB activator)
MLQREMLQYKGEVHEKTMAHSKIQTQFNAMEATLAKETEERRSCQKRNTQLERDVDMLTRLVQSEAKEARARAER